MALDGIFLRHIKSEIEKRGSRCKGVTDLSAEQRGACVRVENIFRQQKAVAFCTSKFTESELLFVNTRKSCTTSDVLYAFAKKNRRRKACGTSPERLRPCPYA